MAPVFCAVGHGPHTPQTMAGVVGWGFNYMMSYPGPDPWPDEVKLGHEFGMTMICRWPDWDCLGCLGEDMAFRTADGMHNSGYHALVDGPSHWCEEADERALKALPRIVDAGWDGVLVQTMISDRPFPTAWHLSTTPQYKTTYWAFDEWAQKDWKAMRNGRSFPAKPDIADQEAYKWYQGAWLRRLHRLTDAALTAGMKHIWMFVVPMFWFEDETQADATADSEGAIENWRQSVIEEGAEPVVVVGHMFGMGSAWEKKARKSMQELNGPPWNWRSIVSMECSNPESAVQNLDTNANQARSLGFCGVEAYDMCLSDKKGHIRWER